MAARPATPKEEEVPGSLGAKLEAALRKRPLQTIGMIRVAPLPGGRERPYRSHRRPYVPSPLIPTPVHPSIHPSIHQFIKARAPTCGASRDP